MFGADEQVVARHDRHGPGPRSTLDEHLPDYRASFRHRRREYWEERAAKIGDDVASFVREVFDSDEVLSQLRKVQHIVTHLEKFPPERACATARRASFFGAMSYKAIRDILRRGLDLHPLPDATSAPESAWTPRFARDTRTLALSRVDSDGGAHGPH